MFSDSEQENSAPEEISFVQGKEAAIPKYSLSKNNLIQKGEPNKSEELDFIPFEAQIANEKLIKVKTKITIKKSILTPSELNSLKKLKASLSYSQVERKSCSAMFKTAKILKSEKKNKKNNF